MLWICFSNTRTIGPSLRKSSYQIGCAYLRVHLSLTFPLIAVQKLPCLSIAGLWNFYCLLTCMYGGLNTCMIISLNSCWILGGGRQAGGTIVLFSMMFPKIIFSSPFFAFICISNLYASGCYFFRGNYTKPSWTFRISCAHPWTFDRHTKSLSTFILLQLSTLRLFFSLHVSNMWFFKGKIVSLLNFLSQIALLPPSA